MNLTKELQRILTSDGERATLWREAFPASQAFLTSLSTALSDGFGVFVLANDDVTERNGAAVLVPRDNVVFEAGVSVGGLGLSRTIFLSPTTEKLHLPTDFQGVSQVRYSPQPGARLGDPALRDLARTLATEIVGHMNAVEGREAAEVPAGTPYATSPALDAAGVTLAQVLAARATFELVGSGSQLGLGSFVSHRLFGNGRVTGRQGENNGNASASWLVQFTSGPCLVPSTELVLLL